MKKIISIIMAMFIMLAGLTACKDNKTEKAMSSGEQAEKNTDASETEKVNYDTVYNSVLEEFYYMIKYASNQSEVKEGFTGAVEAAQAFEDEALSEIGYLISDINGDGIKELLIGISDDEEGVYVKNDIYALYTIKNTSPVLVAEGRSRNWYSLVDGGKIFNFGSNGAAYRIFGEYSLESNAELKCKDFYFSYDKDGSYTNIGFFHNTTGIYDMAQAKELDISQEEFEKKEEDLAKRTIKLTFTPFSSFTPSGDGAEIFNADQTGDPLFMTINGEWRTIVKTDVEDWVLDLNLYSDGSASYKIGYYESEYVVYHRGKWNPSSGKTAITLEMNDEYGSGPFKGEFLWNVKNGTLTLMHKSGDPLLYEMEGKSITFNKR